jgi:hypothetical protein
VQCCGELKRGGSWLGLPYCPYMQAQVQNLGHELCTPMSCLVQGTDDMDIPTIIRPLVQLCHSDKLQLTGSCDVVNHKSPEAMHTLRTCICRSGRYKLLFPWYRQIATIHQWCRICCYIWNYQSYPRSVTFLSNFLWQRCAGAGTHARKMQNI